MRTLCLGLLGLALGFSVWAEVPTLNEPVVDLAGVISRQRQNQLDQIIRHIHDHGGPQISVLIVPDLGGEEIEPYSIKVVEKTRLGSAKQDNGVLLLLALKERKLRIEVGQGLEGVLTDAHSRRIIDNVIVPQLRQGDFDGAITSGVLSIIEHVYPQGLEQLKNGDIIPKRSANKKHFPFGIFIFFLILILLLRGGRRRRSGLADGLIGYGLGRASGGWGGGSWGGGSSGGGSWGGGGGGFSGGGASGSW